MTYTEEEFEVASKKAEALKFPEACEAEIAAYAKYLEARKTWEAARNKLTRIWNSKQKLMQELYAPNRER